MILPMPQNMTPISTRTKQEQRRLRGIALLDQGLTQVKVARELRVTPAAVCQWARTHRHDGKKALKARPHPGPTPKLTGRQLSQLEKMLLKGPRPHGFSTERWTLQRVAELVDHRFGVTYDPSGIWHVLRRLGWSCRKPDLRGRGLRPRKREEDTHVQWRKKARLRTNKRATKR